jgi:hypothetical protein
MNLIQPAKFHTVYVTHNLDMALLSLEISASEKMHISPQLLFLLCLLENEMILLDLIWLFQPLTSSEKRVEDLEATEQKTVVWVYLFLYMDGW